MYIQVARIPPEGSDFEGSESGCFKEEPDKLWFKVLSPVDYSFKAYYVSGELVVTGRLEVEVEVQCSRCAVPFTMKVVDKRFDVGIDAPEGTESVDLTADMREAILCAFPSHPVCRKECKGLCAQCGKDLNQGVCGCVPPGHNRWESLEGLKL